MENRTLSSEEYIEELCDICASFNEEAFSFFTTMEEQGINILNDTGEHGYPILDYIYAHAVWMVSLFSFLIQNNLLDYNKEIWKCIPSKYILSPEEIFHALSSKTPRVQLELLKLSCPQHALNAMLASIRDNRLSDFLKIFETDKLDLMDLSKYIRLLDIDSHMMSTNENVREFMIYEKADFMKDLFCVKIDGIPEIALKDLLARRQIWLYGDLLPKNDFNQPDWTMNFIARSIELEKLIHHYYQSDEEVESSDLCSKILTMWEFFAKCIVIIWGKLFPPIQRIIRPVFSPFYLMPEIERLQSEFEEILKREAEEGEHYKTMSRQSEVLQLNVQSPIDNAEFSLSPDFFKHETHGGSFHMNICNEVKDAGVEKFEKLLVGLADQGYVTKEALPLLAYRLSGCGRPFGEEQVVWLGDKRVIRFIIAKFHAIGTHYVGPLNKYFVDAYGQTFLQGISADLARNIKSLAIFKDVISPLYKDIIRLL